MYTFFKLDVMTKLRSIAHAFIAVVVFTSLAPECVAAEKGSFGFSLEVESDGTSFNPMNPTLKSASITKVVAGSSSETAGLRKGDQLLEIEGRSVAGAKANDLKSHLSKNLGETLSLKVKKSTGEIVVLLLEAGKINNAK